VAGRYKIIKMSQTTTKTVTDWWRSGLTSVDRRSTWHHHSPDAGKEFREEESDSPDCTFLLMHFYLIVKRLFLLDRKKTPREKITTYDSGRQEAGAWLGAGLIPVHQSYGTGYNRSPV
jgi:hypothetical protein